MEEVQTIQSPQSIEKNHCLHLLYQMMLIRRFEEKSAELYSKEKIRGFLHLYIGEEAVAVGIMQALSAEDNILSTYREHGHALARGIDAGMIMAEMYGKEEGCSHGGKQARSAPRKKRKPATREASLFRHRDTA